MPYICENELLEIYKNIEDKLTQFGLKCEIALIRDYMLKVQITENDSSLGKLIIDYSPKKQSHNFRKDSDMSDEKFQQILGLLGVTLLPKTAAPKVNNNTVSAASGKTDVKNSLAESGSEASSHASNIRYHAYVDGSFIDGCVGFGAVILDNGNIVAELSGAVDSPEAFNARQVGGEIQAVIEVLKWCEKNNIDQIAIFYDFLNIEKWATGEYRTNTQMTKEYKEFVDKSNVSITWVKVESHTGIALNDKADELAKIGARSKQSTGTNANTGTNTTTSTSTSFTALDESIQSSQSMTGWIIYNESLKTDKFMEHVNWFVKAAEINGIKLIPFSNNELGAAVIGGQLEIFGAENHEKPQFVIFWDKDVYLAYHLEKMGIRVFNGSECIRICDNKILTHQVLSNHDIPMPKTIAAPMVYPGLNVDETLFLDVIEKALSYPVVVKEAYGSFGAQVYLAKDREELIALRKKLISKPHLYQEFIDSSFGRDVRIQVVGDKVVAAMLRTSENDFRANVTNGSRMENFNPPDAFVKLAVKAARLVGAHFAGVDMLFGKDGSPILCEINSNAHMKNIYTCTRVDVPDCIIKYIKERIAG
ncbi:MAG: RimK family alpha-L-glutamate ligase [Clostridiaceae bacterium]|nr:RimK family alpha-L-glutamate ligase [Clostridiaceae bacterium]